jgi:hypothetical protein
MAATAADYEWIEQSALSGAYCLTLARELSPEAFLARIGAEADRRYTGLRELVQPSMALWEGEEAGESLLMAVTVATGEGGSWALGVEINGFLGVSEELIVPLSMDTTVVSHYESQAGPNRFYWLQDGDILLHFLPLDPAEREGSAPDAAIDAMREVGFDLAEDSDSIGISTAAAFALAERLTGVRVTAEMLEQATYTCGIAPAPPLDG